MIGLWDTTGSAVVKALAAERRSAGGVTSGLALTLITVVDEVAVRTAEDAATIAAQMHPCRLLIVVRADVTHPRSRLDAEIVVGGRLGPCEAVVMRMFGRLALHAESVVEPLLAPDVPVVTWWHEKPPERIAYDPLGVVPDHAVAHAGGQRLRRDRRRGQRGADRGATDRSERGAARRLAGRAPWRETTDRRGQQAPQVAASAPRRRGRAGHHPQQRNGDPATHRVAGPHDAVAAPAAGRRAGRGAAPPRRRPAVRRGAAASGLRSAATRERLVRVARRSPRAGPVAAAPKRPAERTRRHSERSWRDRPCRPGPAGSGGGGPAGGQAARRAGRAGRGQRRAGRRRDRHEAVRGVARLAGPGRRELARRRHLVG